MGECRLEILGTPRAVREGECLTRLRTKRDWCVLASLALEPGRNERGELAKRFWPEAASPLQNLRSALTAIRSAFGADILEEEAGKLRLRSGCVTDIDEVRDVLRQVRRQKDAGDPARKAAILRDAALLVRGPFLEGIDTSGEIDWVERQRSKFHQEVIALFREWLAMCRASGDEAGMAEAAERLLAINPDDPDVQNLILQRPDHIVHRLNAKMDWSATERILSTSPTEKIPLTYSDAMTLQALLEKCLDALPKNLRRSLCLLSVFPGLFTAEQAEGVCGVVGAEIERFVEMKFLFCTSIRQAVSCPPAPPLMGGIGVGNSSCFALHPPVRDALWRRLTGGERDRLAERHAKYFTTKIWDAYRAGPEEYRRWTNDKVSIINLSQAIDWYLGREPCDEGIKLIESVRESWEWLGCNHPEVQRLRQAIPYLQSAISAYNPHVAWIAAITIARLEADKRNFTETVRYAQISLDLFRGDSPREHAESVGILLALLDALHHAEEDDLFDQTVTMMLAYDFSALDETRRMINLHRSHFVIAENRMARCRYAEALHHSEEAWTLAESVRLRRPEGLARRGPILYQHGSILQGLGRMTEAREFYNRAHDDFEEAAKMNGTLLHGVASCLRNLASLNREEGRYSEARGLLDRARELFERVGDPAAVVSCDLVLGDVRRDRGEWDEAERLYRAGLTFWREKGHHRWISSCEARLQELQARRQEGKEEAK